MPDIHPVVRLVVAAVATGLAAASRIRAPIVLAVISLVLNLTVAGVYFGVGRQAEAGRQAAFENGVTQLAMFARTEMDRQDARAHRTLWNDLQPAERRQRLGGMLDYFTKQYSMTLGRDCPFDVEAAKKWMMTATEQEIAPVQMVLFAARNSGLNREFFMRAGESLKAHFP